MTQATITAGGTTTTVAYTYDDDGNRVVEAVTGGTKSTYLVDKNQANAQVLEEYTGSTPALTATYVRGADLLFQDRGGTRSYYVKDALGSTRALTGSSGSVTDTYVYDAFGQTLNHTGSTANSFMYAGQQYDSNIQQYYMRARDYNPESGIFTSRDPFFGNTEKPMTFSKYEYVHDDPVNFIDATGMFTAGDVNMGTTLGAAAETGSATVVASSFVNAMRVLTFLVRGDTIKKAVYLAAAGTIGARPDIPAAGAAAGGRCEHPGGSAQAQASALRRLERKHLEERTGRGGDHQNGRDPVRSDQADRQDPERDSYFHRARI